MVVLQTSARSAGPRGGLLAGLLVAFAAAFVVATPGSVFEYEEFRRDIEYERMHYGEGGHGVYTLEAGWPHLRRMLGYLGGQPSRPSTWRPGSSPAWRCSGYAIARERLMLLVLVACFPVLYVAYMSTMIVGMMRNVLVISPFLALFAARASPTWSRSRGRASCAPIGATAAILAGHAMYNAQAAERTRNRSLDRSLTELAAHIEDESDTVFALSPKVF